MNTWKLDPYALEYARKQFCLDIGLPWEEYLEQSKKRAFIQRAEYHPGTNKINVDGARDYERRNDFFHAIVCLGQLFLVVDERIYDWAVENFCEYPPEWFCEFGNLRRIDEKLKEYGYGIKDTHVYMLPTVEKNLQMNGASTEFVWFDQQEILHFQERNQFERAICFSKTQPDMLAVAAWRDAGIQKGRQKCFDQEQLAGMAGVSADGRYLWQIGINVRKEAEEKGLASSLVCMLKEAVLRQGRIPFYGTSESHTISQTVGLKAGFAPAWTEVYAGQR